MSKRLYVGGLPYSVDNDQLRQLFEQAGEVISAEVVYDRARENWSKGFGFVEMPDDAALRAIEMFHNSELGGRTLTVNEARPREERPAMRRDEGGFNRGGDRGGFNRGGDRGFNRGGDRGYGQRREEGGYTTTPQQPQGQQPATYVQDLDDLDQAA